MIALSFPNWNLKIVTSNDGSWADWLRYPTNRDKAPARCSFMIWKRRGQYWGHHAIIILARDHGREDKLEAPNPVQGHIESPMMSDTNISLDIVREGDDAEHWLNRICRNHDTGVRKAFES